MARPGHGEIQFAEVKSKALQPCLWSCRVCGGSAQPVKAAYVVNHKMSLLSLGLQLQLNFWNASRPSIMGTSIACKLAQDTTCDLVYAFFSTQPA